MLPIRLCIDSYQDPTLQLEVLSEHLSSIFIEKSGYQRWLKAKELAKEIKGELLHLQKSSLLAGEESWKEWMELCMKHQKNFQGEACMPAMMLTYHVAEQLGMVWFSDSNLRAPFHEIRQYFSKIETALKMLDQGYSPQEMGEFNDSVGNFLVSEYILRALRTLSWADKEKDLYGNPLTKMEGLNSHEEMYRVFDDILKVAEKEQFLTFFEDLILTRVQKEFALEEKPDTQKLAKAVLYTLRDYNESCYHHSFLRFMKELPASLDDWQTGIDELKTLTTPSFQLSDIQFETLQSLLDKYRLQTNLDSASTSPQSLSLSKKRL